MTNKIGIRLAPKDNTKDKVVKWDEFTRVLVLKDSVRVTFEIYKELDGSIYPASNSNLEWDLWDVNSKTSFNWVTKRNGVIGERNETSKFTRVSLSLRQGYKSKHGYWLEAFTGTSGFEKGATSPDALSMLIFFQPPKPTVKATWLNIDNTPVTDSKYLGQWVKLKLETTGLVGETVRVSLWDDRYGDTSLLYEYEGKHLSHERFTTYSPEEGVVQERWAGKSIHDKLVFPKNYEAFQKYRQTIGTDGTLTFLISLSKSWEQHKVMWGDSIQLRVLVDHPRLEKYAVREVWYGIRPNSYDPNYIIDALKVRTPDSGEFPETEPDAAPKTVVIKDNIIMESKATEPCHFKFIGISEQKKPAKATEKPTTERYYKAFEEEALMMPTFSPYEVTGNPEVLIELVDPKDPSCTAVKTCVSDGVPNMSSHGPHKDNVLQIPLATGLISYEKPKKSAAEETLKAQVKQFTVSNKTSLTFGGSSFSRGNTWSSDQQKMVVTQHTETQLKFMAAFHYNTNPISIWGIVSAPFMLRYLWKGAFYSPKVYTILAKTCRYQKEILVHAYPDVQWEAFVNLNLGKRSRSLGSGIKRTNNQKKDKAKADAAVRAIADKKTTYERINYGLKVKFDGGENIDMAAPFKSVIDGIIDILSKPAEALKKTIMGEKKSGDGKYAEPSAKDKEKVAQIAERNKAKLAKREEKAKEIKIKQKARAKETLTQLQAENATIARLKKSTDPKDKAKLIKAENRRDALTTKLSQRGNKADMKLQRDMVTFNILYPNLSFSAAWYLEGVKATDPQYKVHYGHQVGTVVSGSFKATPLLGLELSLDLLALAQRAHPIVLALIAAVDVAMSIVGDGSGITCNVKASGDIGGNIGFKINTLTGKATYREDTKLTSDLKLGVEASIKLQKEAKVTKLANIMTGVASVSGKLTLELKAEAHWHVDGLIKADDKGIYMDPYWNFEGLTFEGLAKIEAEMEMDKAKKEEQPKKHGISEELTVKYLAIDKQEQHPMGKFYFNHAD